MGIRILAGKRINDCNVSGAVLFESCSMLAYPYIFEDGENAQRFVAAYPRFAYLSEREQSDAFTAWQKGERPAPAKTSLDEYDELLADVVMR